MRFLTTALAVLALAFTPALRAFDEPPEARSKQTPKQQFQSVLDDEDKVMKDYSAAVRKAWAAGEKPKVKYPDRSGFTERCLAIAEAHPGDPASVDALIWVVQRGGIGIYHPTSTGPKNSNRIQRLVIQNAENPKIGRCAAILSRSDARWVEGALKAIAERNSDRASRGQATLGLAHYITRLIEMVRALHDDPKQADQMAPSLTAADFDKEGIARLKTTAHEVLAKEAEALYEKVTLSYSDIADIDSGSGTIGKTAAGRLNEIRNLGIGKPCPEIAGEDIDGKPLKLSDYKGKVVAVVFWGTWCGPCMASIPHERSLVKSMEGKPFVLIGVNSDGDKDKLHKRMKEENITWRSWWDGGDTSGPIATQFNIRGWPTLYVVDHEGVIRHKWLGFPGEETFDKAVAALVARAEGKKAERTGP
jgi:thiol-disulfide isomerase/thioredoxin